METPTSTTDPKCPRCGKRPAEAPRFYWRTRREHKAGKPPMQVCYIHRRIRRMKPFPHDEIVESCLINLDAEGNPI